MRVMLMKVSGLSWFLIAVQLFCCAATHSLYSLFLLWLQLGLALTPATGFIPDMSRNGCHVIWVILKGCFFWPIHVRRYLKLKKRIEV